MCVRYSLLLLIGCLFSCNATPDPRLVRLRLLADTQQRSNDWALREARNTVKSIDAIAARNHYPKMDVAVLAQAQAILQYIEAVSKRIRRMRAAVLNQGSGGYSSHDLESQQVLAGASPQDKLGSHIDSLSAHLRAFSSYMQPLAPKDSAALTAINQALATLTSYQPFYFEDAAAEEVVAALAQQEAEVLYIGAQCLANQALRVSSPFSDSVLVGAYAVAESNTVRVGETYTADLLLTNFHNFIRGASMTANGDTIQIGPDGRGRVQFRAPSLAPGQTIKHAVWLGTISLRYQGSDTTFRVRVPYTITR